MGHNTCILNIRQQKALCLPNLFINSINNVLHAMVVNTIMMILVSTLTPMVESDSEFLSINQFIMKNFLKKNYHTTQLNTHNSINSLHFRWHFVNCVCRGPRSLRFRLERIVRAPFILVFVLSRHHENT